jgi:16S rRNA (guanine527-N7)-methyltransferase
MISREFSLAGLDLSERELERFLWLDDLLMERKDDLDLTRIDDPLSIIVKHYLDGAMAAELIEPGGLLMDLGSGAGFPGLAIAIRRPDWPILLSEPRMKKLAFMEEAVNLLGLDNVEFYPHKVGPRFDRQIQSIVARDFGSVSAIMSLAAPILPPGGKLFLMKGDGAEAELEVASEFPEWDCFQELGHQAYRLPTMGLKRRILAFSRRGGRDWAQKSWPRGRVQPKITEISSRVNSRYKAWVKLSDGRHIRKSGECLISGGKAIKDFLSLRPQLARGVLGRRLDDFEGFSIPPHIPVFLVRQEIFPDLDAIGTGPPLLLAEAPEIPAWDPDESFAGLRFFVPFQDPSNVGAIIRSAAAFGAGIVLLKEAASPYHPKALRASGPATYLAALSRGPSLSRLSAMGLGHTLALSAQGRDIYSFRPPESLSLVMGLEGPGLDHLWPPEKRLAIPMRPGLESLNASAAAVAAMAILGGKMPKGRKLPSAG